MKRLLPLLLPILFLIYWSCEDEQDFYPTMIADGYLDKISYHVGDKAKLYINAVEEVKNGVINVRDITGEEIDRILCHLQPQTITNLEPWKDGCGYNASCTYEIPNLPSGIYELDNSGIFFIIKTNEQVDAVVVYPSNTLNAYSVAGGKSLYKPTGDRAQQVSFLRPMTTWSGHWRPIFEWLKTQTQYNLGYISDMDLYDYAEIDKSSLLVITGHSEYWTRKARENFDQFVDLGNDAMVLSGNSMWWQVRYDSSKTQLVCYKGSPEDPLDETELESVRWIEPQLNYPIIKSIGADFDRGGFGTNHGYGLGGYKIVANNSPLLEGLYFSQGDILYISTNEYDGAPINGFDESGFPVIDKELLGFFQIELIGFDRPVNRFGVPGVGTFIVFQKKEDSGIVINAASMNWGGKNGMEGPDKDKIKHITTNMFNKLLNKESIFTNL